MNFVSQIKLSNHEKQLVEALPLIMQITLKLLSGMKSYEKQATIIIVACFSYVIITRPVTAFHL